MLVTVCGAAGRLRSCVVRLEGVLLEFIKQHWLAYLIGAIVAIGIGLGLADYVAELWSTPSDETEEEVESED